MSAAERSKEQDKPHIYRVREKTRFFSGPFGSSYAAELGRAQKPMYVLHYPILPPEHFDGYRSFKVCFADGQESDIPIGLQGWRFFYIAQPISGGPWLQ